MNTKNKLTKVLLAAFAMLVLGTSAFAIPRGPCEPKPTVCCEEPAPGPFAFSYAKDMNLSCPSDFYINGSFLLMQANEGGLEYAMKQGTGTANAFPLTDGEVFDYTTNGKNTNWNYGVKVAAGFYLNHDAWEVGLAWTYFRINNDSGKISNGGVFLPLWLDPGVTQTANNISSSARWTGNMHAVDLKLGKPYHVSRYLILNPSFGLRFGWIQQNYMVRNGGTFVAPIDITDINVDMVANNDFWGVGPRFALDSEWHVASCWYLFANASASMLYSHFDVDQKVLMTNTVRSQIKHEFYTGTTNADMALGLCWHKGFCKNKYVFNVKAAYEFQAWFDQNRLRRFFDTVPSANDEVARGDLFLSGFAFSIGADF